MYSTSRKVANQGKLLVLLANKRKEAWLKINSLRSVKTSTSRTPRQIALAQIDEAQTTRKELLEKLETAQGKDIFVINMLLDLNEIQAYTAQTRIQAEQSFKASQIASYVGYILIIIAVSLGIILTVASALIDTISVTLDTAYLSAIAGLISEFISGVFFSMYNKTITQVNLFHDKMMESKKEALSVLINVLNNDPTRQNEAYAELAKSLMAKKTGA
jgi:hypothetical protein